MNKHLAKTAFGVPSTETTARIDDSDKCQALGAAHFRFDTKLMELEMQFEAKASELRSAYLEEVVAIHQSEAA